MQQLTRGKQPTLFAPTVAPTGTRLVNASNENGGLETDFRRRVGSNAIPP